MLCHVTRMTHIDHALRTTMQNESWHADGGQITPHIDFAIHSHNSSGRASACRCVVITRYELYSFWVTDMAGWTNPALGPEIAEQLQLSPMLLNIVERSSPLLMLPTERVIRGPRIFGIGTVQHQ